MSVLSFCKAL